MTREETLKLLSVLMANYPYAAKKIEDAAKMADTWEMVLGSYEAEAVYKAARLHMEKSKFFPTPADILEKVTRAAVLYNEAPAPKAIEASSMEKQKEAYYLEELCKFVGLGCDPDMNADLTLEYFLPYEK